MRGGPNDPTVRIRTVCIVPHKLTPILEMNAITQHKCDFFSVGISQDKPGNGLAWIAGKFRKVQEVKSRDTAADGNIANARWIGVELGLLGVNTPELDGTVNLERHTV